MLIENSQRCEVAGCSVNAFGNLRIVISVLDRHDVIGIAIINWGWHIVLIIEGRQTEFAVRSGRHRWR